MHLFMKINLKAIVVLWIIIVFLAGCGGNTEPPIDAGERILLVQNGQADIEVTVASLKELTPVIMDVESVNSDGEINTFSIKGALFSDVLARNGKTQQDLNAIRLVAGDGYSIEVIKDILVARDIILAYEIDGEPLKDDVKPVRIIIPDERAMYWVRNLMRIEIYEPAEVTAITELHIIESTVVDLASVEYLYDGSLDQGVKTTDIVQWDTTKLLPTVRFFTTDGMDKNETWDNFRNGLIKWSGTEVPAFVSENIPRGMHVKEILWFTAQHQGYLSYVRALQYYDSKSIQGNTGVLLKDVLSSINFKSGVDLRLTATDGYAIVIAADDIDKGLLYETADQKPGIIFSGMPANTHIKGLLKIETVE